jgi:uncharacterized Fe-S center protein
MNQFFRRRLGLVTALATVLLLTTCFIQAEGTGALVVDRCQECHGLDKTCAVQSDDAQWWSETVARMVEYKDGLLNADETAALSRFLAEAKNRASVCAAP